MADKRSDENTKGANMRACTCGHAEDDHGHDPKYPASSACRMGSTDESKDAMLDDCECVCFEADDESEPA